MLHFLKKKNKTAFAIDIGSYHTKIMDVAIDGNRITVQKFIIQRTPEGCFESGNVLDKDRLAQFLIQVIATIDSDKTKVITGVTGKGFVTKKIDIPEMSHNLIGEHIPFEAEQYLPYEISDVDLDYEVIKNFESSDSDRISILLIAVLKSVVEQYNSLFQQAYLECTILDANAFAVANAFEWNHKTEGNVLLIDIGAKGTNLIAMSNNQVVFTRNLGVGGELYTKDIQNSMSVSFEEAENIKIRASEGGEEGAIDGLGSLIKSSSQSFCEEVYSGYEFYLNFFPNHKTERAFITGGGSQIPNLAMDLESKFSIPVSFMNLLENVNVSTDLDIKNKNWEKFASVCIGLALRNTD